MGLAEKLDSLSESDLYPFHMPGHKRHTVKEGIPADINTRQADWLESVYRHDITEIDDFDDLQEPHGIIAGIEERIARYYGSDKAFLSVNGSSLGNLASVSYLVPNGGVLLMDRGAHRSVYNAVRLKELKALFLERETVQETGLTSCIGCNEVERRLFEAEKEGRMPQAVIITSPTYDGFLADVKGIADIVHGYDLPLIVDGAHGAHLETDRNADITVVSLHKTLPALTQLSAILVNGNRVEAGKLKEHINIFQTTSPSYILMASADRCFDILDRDGDRLKKELKDSLDSLYALNHKLKRLYLTGPEHAGSYGIYDHDPGRINIMDRTGEMTGRDIYDTLRTVYRLQPERATGKTCLLIAGMMDSREGFMRLQQALLAMDDGNRGKENT